MPAAGKGRYRARSIERHRGWFNQLLEQLPNLIAADEDTHGRPFTLTDPGTAHGRALLLSLGVTIAPARTSHRLPAA